VASHFVRRGPRLLRWTGAGGAFDYEIDARVFMPTLISEAIVEALESIGDLGVVLDVGCGGGFLAIVAARLGASHVYATDISAAATTLARRNVVEAGVADRVSVVTADGVDAFDQDDMDIDVLINDISGVPDAIAQRMGWYPEEHSRGGDGIALPLAIIDTAPRLLRKDTGRLVQPMGSVQFTPAIRRRLDHLFGKRTIAAYRQFFLPKDQFSGDLGDIDTLRREGRMRLWEARGLLWWDAEVVICQAPRARRAPSEVSAGGERTDSRSDPAAARR
jgi:SAM-dependent methyltransferase